MVRNGLKTHNHRIIDPQNAKGSLKLYKSSLELTRTTYKTSNWCAMAIVHPNRSRCLNGNMTKLTAAKD